MRTMIILMTNDDDSACISASATDLYFIIKTNQVDIYEWQYAPNEELHMVTSR